MKVHEFFAWYANLPMTKRFQIINMAKFGTMTFSQAYHRINELENKIRPYQIEEESILEEIEWLNAKMEGGKI